MRPFRPLALAEVHFQVGREGQDGLMEQPDRARVGTTPTGSCRGGNAGAADSPYSPLNPTLTWASAAAVASDADREPQIPDPSTWRCFRGSYDPLFALVAPWRPPSTSRARQRAVRSSGALMASLGCGL